MAHELLSKQDYSLEESEELPVVLLPLVEEAPLSILGLSGLHIPPHLPLPSQSYPTTADKLPMLSVGTSTAYQAEDEGTSAEAVMLAALKASAPAWARLKAVVSLLAPSME